MNSQDKKNLKKEISSWKNDSVEVIDLITSDDYTPGKWNPNKTPSASVNKTYSFNKNNDDVQIIEDVRAYNLERVQKRKLEELQAKNPKNIFIKNRGVFFEHYLGCIDTESILLSAELGRVKNSKDLYLNFEIKPKMKKNSVTSYSLMVPTRYTISEDHVRIRTKNYGEAKLKEPKPQKGKTPRRRNSTFSSSIEAAVENEMNKITISACNKFKEFFKCKNEVLNDILKGCVSIRVKHNENEVSKINYELSKCLTILVVLNAIRVELEFDNIPENDIRLGKNVRVYIHVILYPDAFKIDYHKFDDEVNNSIRISVNRLLDELKLKPLRAATIKEIKHDNKKMTLTKNEDSISIVSETPSKSFTYTFNSANNNNSSNKTPPKLKNIVNSFSGYETPYHALGGPKPKMTPRKSILTAFSKNDIEIIDPPSISEASDSVEVIDLDEENPEVNEVSEEVTNIVFVEEKYRGGILIEEFGEIYPNKEYFLPTLKEYQAEGVWWMYNKENPPDFASLTSKDNMKQEIIQSKLVKKEGVHSQVKDDRVTEQGDVCPNEEPLSPYYDEYMFTPEIQIYEQNKYLCSLKYFYVNRSTGIMSLNFPQNVPLFRGGILADDMGLGKTIQSIALISHDIIEHGLHLKKETKQQSMDYPHMIENTIKGTIFQKGGTLVIAPLALLTQWKEEIERHTVKGFLSTYVYYAGMKNVTSEELSKYSVVLTTYNTLVSEFKKASEQLQNKNDTDNKKKSAKRKPVPLNEYFKKTKLIDTAKIQKSDTSMTPTCVQDFGSYNTTLLDYFRTPSKTESNVTSSGESSPFKLESVKKETGSVPHIFGDTNERNENKQDGDNKWEGCIYQIIWRRIILDEAHVIKNKNSIQSVAVWRLRGERKWCITGTPIQNTFSDIFPLFRFIGIHPYSNIEWWNKEIMENLNKNRLEFVLEKIRSISSPLMLRRTKESKTKDGRFIITLPQKLVLVEQLHFTKEEEDFYRAVFLKTKTKFDTYVQDTERFVNYTHILQLISLLRQCCAHPFMIISKSLFEEWKLEEELAKAEAFLKMNLGEVKKEGVSPNVKSEPSSEGKTSGYSFFKKESKGVKREPSEEKNVSGIGGNNNAVRSENNIIYNFLLNSTKDKKIDAEFLNLVSLLEKGINTTCVICCDEAVLPLVTKCSHVLCKKCAYDYLHLTQISDKKCPGCDAYINMKSLKTLKQNSSLVELLNRMTKKDFVYSTKLRRLLQCVQEDMEKNIHVVVFSQWTRYLKIIERLFVLHNIDHKIYDGSLSFNDRRNVLEWFNIHDGKIYCPGVGFVEPTEPLKFQDEQTGGKVLLCSLKAGGVGLNLTVASKLYLLDLWWNPAIEEQAIQRVHRIGQLKDVEIVKFVMAKTIEERILEIHDSKNYTANQIMTQEGNMVKAGPPAAASQKLGKDEIMFMFKDWNNDDENKEEIVID